MRHFVPAADHGVAPASARRKQAPRQPSSPAKAVSQSQMAPAAFLSARATVDTVLLPVHTYSCLAEIEKRCGIYRVSPTLFASLVRALAIEQPNGVVLNCMARDTVVRGTFGELCSALKAIEVTQKIPPFKDCTEELRENFRKYLYATTHLKTVFAFAEAGQLSKVLGINNLLQRVMKYLGKSESRPNKVYLLENGAEGLCQLRLPMTLLQMRVSCQVVITARGDQSIGVAVVSRDQLRTDTDCLEVFEFCKRTGHQAVLNLTSRTLPADRALSVLAPNTELLPLRTKADAVAFHVSVYEQAVQLVEKRISFCIIDSQYKNLSALILAMVLIDVGKQSVVDACNVVRTRLNPPEFDGYAMAALSHLADLAEPDAAQRRTRAIACVAERFAVPVKEKDKEGGQAPDAASPSILEGARQLSLAEKWAQMQEMLRSNPLPRAKVEAICKLIEGMCNRVLTNPADMKVRAVRLNNPKLQSVFGAHSLGPQILQAAGWLRTSDSWLLPSSARLQLLRDVLVYISNMNLY